MGAAATKLRESALRFYALHAGLPALVALVVLGVFETTNLDVRIENAFYDPVAKSFPLRVHYLFETVVHDFGRLSIILLGAALVAGALLSYRRPSLQRFRRGFLYAALCLAVAPVTIAQIKHNSVIHCPRDLVLYGDDQPYVRLFDPVPAGLEPGHCWPGGHSSGGFAIMSLYFVFRRVRPRLALAWLAGGFLYGFGLGFGRVMQGAHFVSHNLWAAAICWAVALVLYELILRRHVKRRPTSGCPPEWSVAPPPVLNGRHPGSSDASRRPPAPGTPLALCTGMSAREPRRHEQPEPSEAEPEDVEVSLLFCDVVRSTELTRRLGDRGAYLVIQDFHNLVLRAAEPFAGRELELRGDGVLLAFDGPQHAVDCAVEIQRGLQKMAVGRRVSARIGVHTGRALRVEGGYFGSNVILSARVAEEAAPSEILVSAAIVQRLAANPPPVDAGRWVSLKGIPEANLVFSLRWRPRRAPRVGPQCSSTAHAAMVHTLGRSSETKLNEDEASCMLAERGGV